jgi:hypothetical protein
MDIHGTKMPLRRSMPQSGYKRTDLPEQFRDRLLVEKPIEISKLKAAIATVLGGQNAR